MRTNLDESNTELLNQNQENSKIPSLVYIIAGIILGVCIILLFYFSLVYLLLFVIPSKLIIFTSLLIIHLYLLRRLIIICVFPGMNKFLVSYVALSQVKNEIRFYLSILLKTKHQLKQLGSNRSLTKQSLLEIQQGYGYIDTSNTILEVLNRNYNGLRHNSIEYSKLIIKAHSLFQNSGMVSLFNWDDNSEDEEEVEIMIEEDNKYINPLIETIDKLISVLANEYKEKYETTTSLVCNVITNRLSNDLFLKKEYIRVKSLLNYNHKELTIISKDKTKLDCVLLTQEAIDNTNSIAYFNRNSQSTNTKTLIIYCLPNFTSIENMISFWDLQSIFLSNNCDMLFWNYRGYGFSEGKVSLTNVTQDIESIHDFIRANYNWRKIGVYGFSIGGIPACHLANNRPIDLLIADRTFGSLDELFLSLTCGKLIYCLSKLVCIPSITNTTNYLNANCKKIVLFDPNDTMILEPVSLATSVTEELIGKISNMKYKHFIDNAMTVSQKELFNNSVKTIYSFMNDYNENKDIIDKNNDLVLEFISTSMTQKKFEDALYNRVKFLLLGLESVGVLFDRFLDKKNPQQYIQMFIDNMVVWGIKMQINDLSIASNDNIDVNIQYFVKGVKDFLNKKEFKEYHQCEIVHALEIFNNGIASVLSLIEKMKKDNSNSLLYNKNRKGNLIILSCGHNSFLRTAEIESLKYLMQL